MAKKKIILLIFLFAICVPFVQSQNSSSELSLNKLDSVKNISTLEQTTNNALGQEVQIPENLQLFAKVMFGLTSEVTFQTLVISFAVWLFILIFIHSILDILPLFSGWKSWLGSFLVMILIGISGGLTLIIQAIVSISFWSALVGKDSFLSFLLSIVFILILLFISLKINHLIKSSWKIEENKIVGKNINFASKMGEVQREDLEDLSDDDVDMK